MLDGGGVVVRCCCRGQALAEGSKKGDDVAARGAVWHQAELVKLQKKLSEQQVAYLHMLLA